MGLKVFPALVFPAPMPCFLIIYYLQMTFIKFSYQISLQVIMLNLTQRRQRAIHYV